MKNLREILAGMKQGHQRANLAFDIYAHRLQAGIGAMVAVLGGESTPSCSPRESGRILLKCGARHAANWSFSVSNLMRRQMRKFPLTRMSPLRIRGSASW